MDAQTGVGGDCIFAGDKQGSGKKLYLCNSLEMKCVDNISLVCDADQYSERNHVYWICQDYRFFILINATFYHISVSGFTDVINCLFF